MTAEGGKPLVENSDEVGWTAAAFDYYAEMGRNFAGRVIPPIESTQLALVVKEPIGAVGVHRALELPAAPARLEGGAGARGGEHRRREAVGANAAVDADAGRLLRRTCRRAWSTWSPAPAMSARRSSTTSASRASRSRARWRPASRSPPRARTRVARMNLEMGGKDPFIVCADVAGDVQVAARGGAWAAYLNAGQVCTSAERFYVAREVYDDFLSEFVDYTSSLRVGDPIGRVDRSRPDGLGAAAREGRGPAVGGRGRGRGAGGGRRPCRLRARALPRARRRDRRAGHDALLREETFGPVAPIVPGGLARRGDPARERHALRARRERLHARPRDRGALHARDPGRARSGSTTR